MPYDLFVHACILTGGVGGLGLGQFASPPVISALLRACILVMAQRFKTQNPSFQVQNPFQKEAKPFSKPKASSNNKLFPPPFHETKICPPKNPFQTNISPGLIIGSLR